MLFLLKTALNAYPMCYGVVVFVLLTGLSAGMRLPFLMPDPKQSEIVLVLNAWNMAYATGKFDFLLLFMQAIWKNLRWVALTYSADLIGMGKPVTLLLPLFRGFTDGFVIGGLILAFKKRAALLAAAMFFPGGILILPGLVYVWARSMQKAWRKRKPERTASSRMQYFKMLLPGIYVILVGCMVQCGVVPWLFSLLVEKA